MESERTLVSEIYESLKRESENMRMVSIKAGNYYSWSQMITIYGISKNISSILDWLADSIEEEYKTENE